MNRCLQVLGLRLAPLHLLALLVALSPLPGSAQALPRIPPISAKAELGVLRVTAPPLVLLNGKPSQLSPGARIHDMRNLLVMSGTLTGHDLTVAFVRDLLGQPHEVWILTDAEIKAIKALRK